MAKIYTNLLALFSQKRLLLEINKSNVDFRAKTCQKPVTFPKILKYNDNVLQAFEENF